MHINILALKIMFIYKFYIFFKFLIYTFIYKQIKVYTLKYNALKLFMYIFI